MRIHALRMFRPKHTLRITNQTRTMDETQKQVLRDAADILQTEAGVMSDYLRSVLGSDTDRTGLVSKIGAAAPHRVSIAVASEERRLRRLANTLLDMLPKGQEQTEED